MRIRSQLAFAGNHQAEPTSRELERFYDQLGIGGKRPPGYGPIYPFPATHWANPEDVFRLSEAHPSGKRAAQAVFNRRAKQDAAIRIQQAMKPEQILWPEAFGKKATTEIRIQKVLADSLEPGKQFPGLSIAYRRSPNEPWQPFIFQPWGYDEHRHNNSALIAHDILTHLIGNLGTHPVTGKPIEPAMDVPGEMQTADFATLMKWMPTGELEKMALLTREADLTIARQGKTGNQPGPNVYSTLMQIAERMQQEDVPLSASFAFTLTHPQVSDRTYVEEPLPADRQKPVNLFMYHYPVHPEHGAEEYTSLELDLREKGIEPIALEETERAIKLAYPKTTRCASTLGNPDQPDKIQQELWVFLKRRRPNGNWRTDEITTYYSAEASHTNHAVYTGHPYEPAQLTGFCVSGRKSVWSRDLNALGKQLQQTYQRFETQKERLLEQGHLPFPLYHRVFLALQKLGEIPADVAFSVSGTGEDLRQKLLNFYTKALKQILEPINEIGRRQGLDAPLIPLPKTWLDTGLAILKPNRSRPD